MKLSQLKYIIMECLDDMELSERVKRRSGEYGSLKRPNTLHGGNDVLRNRSDAIMATKKMPVDQTYKNSIVKAWIKNDRRNKGSLRKPYFFDQSGNIKTHYNNSTYKKSGVGKK